MLPPLRAIPTFSDADYRAALARWETRTKPSGSLGRLESLAAQLAGIQACPLPDAREKRVLIFAADHGVAWAHPEISAYPATVTGQMLQNFKSGGAAVCVLAGQTGATLAVADVGVGERNATRDFSREVAMSDEDLMHAWAAGTDAAASLLPADVLALGEMGIGNTASASALLCLLTGASADETVGRGTGVDDTGLRAKRDLVAEAIALHAPNVTDTWGALRAVGGKEIVALCAAMIGAAHERCAVVVDGFIVTVAALAAVRLAPGLKPYLIFAHRGAEHAHERALSALDAIPLLELGLRLGEGSGAVLALPLIEASARLLGEMAGFADAGVDTGRESRVH
ncbi:MAG: nicotinate-nucleotide--dimethylbenzimidazole phosphoribosyltransferase [Akkermansiaceae bacterium]|nr:nicotinate-nucleotide--dimethylbenzimidazole phosphoribosyltransferase [Armatimonadota bacterium]